MKNLKTISAVFTALSMMFVMSVSQATTLSFDNITNSTGIDLSGQLSVDYKSVAGGVEFKFTNNIGIASSITDVYFDTGIDSVTGLKSNLFSSISINDQSSGVSFDLAPHPGDLPAGNSITPNFDSDFGGDSTQHDLTDNDVTTNGVAANGVNALGESITFLLTFGAGFNYDSYMADLMDGTFRIGMHIQAIEGGGSDSYVNNPNVVPVPAAAWLFGTVLFGFFATTRRKNNS